MTCSPAFAVLIQGIRNSEWEKELCGSILVAPLQCSAVMLVICCDDAGHTELQAGESIVQRHCAHLAPALECITCVIYVQGIENYEREKALYDGIVVEYLELEDIVRNQSNPGGPYSSSMHADMPKVIAYVELWWKCVLRGPVLR